MTFERKWGSDGAVDWVNNRADAPRLVRGSLTVAATNSRTVTLKRMPPALCGGGFTLTASMQKASKKLEPSTAQGGWHPRLMTNLSLAAMVKHPRTSRGASSRFLTPSLEVGENETKASAI